MKLAAFVLVFAATSAAAQTPKGTRIHVDGTNIPVDVLVESPADAPGDLQIICLFEASPKEEFQGSLGELDTKLDNHLGYLRYEHLFLGTLGETMVITPHPGAIGAKRLLVIGLGNRDSFTAATENFIGEIAYTESERLKASSPTFAPTVLDGGKTGINTGDVAKHFMLGFEQGKMLSDELRRLEGERPPVVTRITFLAGPTHAIDTKNGLEAAMVHDIRMIKMQPASLPTDTK